MRFYCFDYRTPKGLMPYHTKDGKPYKLWSYNNFNLKKSKAGNILEYTMYDLVIPGELIAKARFMMDETSDLYGVLLSKAKPETEEEFQKWKTDFMKWESEYCHEVFTRFWAEMERVTGVKIEGYSEPPWQCRDLKADLSPLFTGPRYAAII